MKLLRNILLIFCTVALTACATATPPPAPQQVRPAKVALVLGAGAAKGFAHVGVIKVLEAKKIPIHLVVGTSAGSFVGSLYAYGYDGYALQEMAMSLQKKDVSELTIPSNGFIKGERLRDFINSKVRNQPIEKLKIPFYAVTTDIRTGKEVVFTSGNTGMAVQASAAVPGVYQPARFSGTSYVDGGLVNPVAVDVARRFGADLVIAVDITNDVENSIPTSTMDTIMKSLEIMYHTIAKSPQDQADLVIRPQVGFVGSADFDKRHQAILEGEKATWAVMPALLEKIDSLRNEGRL